MKLLETFKSLVRKVEEIDRKTKELSKSKCYSSNPFAFQQNKTYAWVETVKNKNCQD